MPPLIKEAVLVILSIFALLLYPVLFHFLLIIFCYRYAIQKYVKRDKNIVRVITGTDAVLAARNTYSPKYLLSPVFVVTSKVSVSNIVKVFNEKIISPKENRGKCKYPELTQKIVRKFGYNWYCSVDNFNVADHIRHLYEPDPEKILNREDMTQIVGEETLRQPFNSNLSPWEMIIVKNYVDESEPTAKSVIIFRFSHALCDGYSFVKLMRDLAISPWKGSDETEQKPRKETLYKSFAKWALLLITAPYHMLKSAYFTVDSNEWVNRAQAKEVESVRVQVLKPISVSNLKDARDLHNVSFSSIVISMNTEAILRTMARDNITVDKIHVEMPFPFPDHPNGRLTNHWAGVKMPINICRNDPFGTLKNIEEEYKKLKYSMAPLVSYYMANLVGLLPVMLIPDFDNVMKSTFLLSNFPGPRHEIDLLGYLVKEINLAAGAPSRYGIVSACGSYNGIMSFVTRGDSCILKEVEDAEFLANSYYHALNVLRGDTQQNLIIK